MPLLVGRSPGRRKKHSIKAQSYPRFFCCQEMSKVDRSKSTAEDSKSQVVNSRKGMRSSPLHQAFHQSNHHLPLVQVNPLNYIRNGWQQNLSAWTNDDVYIVGVGE